jgi:DNA-binding NtrC family response regulator
MAIRGRVFIVDDDEIISSMLTRVLKKDDYEVESANDTNNLLEKIKSWGPDVILLDITLPGRSGIDILREMKDREIESQVVMLTADDSAETAVRAMKLGAIDYLTKPFNIDEVKIILRNVMEKSLLREEVTYLRKVSEELIVKDIIGSSPLILEPKEKMKKIALARVSNILITGESGTGKELFSRHIHYLLYGDITSGYAPFIGVNCTAFSESLIESELFGYEKGSFTDAKSDKKGLFEVAKGGVLLLDEIGDMKLDLQSKLLRVLEERTVRRIGGKEDIPIDVTVIATTNQNLDEAVAKGEFRNDLFYRLNAFSLHVPPLRERKEDIPVLADHFLKMFATKYKNKNIKEFSKDAEKLIIEYGWPGNIRELRNVIERIVVLENTECILPKHLPKEILSPSPTTVNQSGQDGSFILPDTGISLEDLERDLIVQAMEMANNKKTKAAKLLNITYDALRYQMKKFNIE